MAGMFIRCDAHPATGGPHLTRGLYVGPYPTPGARLIMCTHRSKRGRVCGTLMMELDSMDGPGCGRDGRQR